MTRKITSSIFSYKNESLEQNIDGILFANPIGLSAGFDYNGYMVQIMKDVGFGFNSVGTVTAKSYQGNKPPRLARLPKSKSLFVNKGFKSEGVKIVEKRLSAINLENNTIGVSVGSSNIPTINTVSKAIDDYIQTFSQLKDKNYIKYFELNISCPNASMSKGFGDSNNLKQLLTEVSALKISKPIYIKMANEVETENVDKLVQLGISKNINGFIFSNLVKDRKNPTLVKSEIAKFEGLKGNFSGKPTQANSNKLIKHVYKNFGKETIIIGCGGVFNANDAYEKIKCGASLVELITGMIFEGPQLIGEINKGLVNLLKKNGYTNISQAIGKGKKD